MLITKLISKTFELELSAGWLNLFYVLIYLHSFRASRARLRDVSAIFVAWRVAVLYRCGFLDVGRLSGNHLHSSACFRIGRRRLDILRASALVPLASVHEDTRSLHGREHLWRCLIYNCLTGHISTAVVSYCVIFGISQTSLRKCIVLENIRV